VTPGDRRAVRVALLNDDAAAAGHAPALAEALRGAGHDVEVIEAPRVRAAEMLLDRRGFAGSLTALPFGVAALLRGGFDVAHALSPADALTALAWRRLAGRPVVAVFTCTEVLDRDRLADRRLRLWLLQRAVQDTDALIAATEESRAALVRWLALDPPVIELHDAAGYERLYRELLARRG
jgi:hypothetical protein